MTPEQLIQQYNQAETDRQNNLDQAGGATRRKAIAVYELHTAHGYTMPQLGELFGVTRQRIYSLIQLVKP